MLLYAEYILDFNDSQVQTCLILLFKMWGTKYKEINIYVYIVEQEVQAVCHLLWHRLPSCLPKGLELTGTLHILLPHLDIVFTHCVLG